jgi:hypothetical protein
MAIINFNSISGVSTISVASSITVGNNVSIGTDRVTATTFSGNLNSTSGATTVAAGSTSAPSISPTGDSNTGIFFPSPDTIAFAEGGTEALRINSSANIGIGTDNPISGRGTSGKVLNVTGNGTNSIISVQAIEGVNDRNAILELLASGNGGSAAEIVFGNTDTTPVTNSPLVFSSYYSGSTVERARISNTGNFQIANGNLEFSTAGKGIDFSAASNAAGMTSELLSDYEEGTWTPGIFDSATGTKTVSGSQGWYTKIGRMVYLGFALNNLNSSTSGDAAITGIPFTSASINQVGACFIADVSGVTYASGYGDIYGRINATANDIQLLQKTTNGTTHTSMAGGSLGTGLVLRGMCMYIV